VYKRESAAGEHLWGIPWPWYRYRTFQKSYA